MIVTGFTEAEALVGLPDLLDEFQHRPWILRPTGVWDADRKLLVIAVEYENDNIDGCRIAARDEVWDCLVACIQFSSNEISFEIENCSYAPVA